MSVDQLAAAALAEMHRGVIRPQLTRRTPRDVAEHVAALHWSATYAAQPAPFPRLFTEVRNWTTSTRHALPVGWP